MEIKGQKDKMKIIHLTTFQVQTNFGSGEDFCSTV